MENHGKPIDQDAAIMLLNNHPKVPSIFVPWMGATTSASPVASGDLKGTFTWKIRTSCQLLLGKSFCPRQREVDRAMPHWFRSLHLQKTTDLKLWRFRTALCISGKGNHIPLLQAERSQPELWHTLTEQNLLCAPQAFALKTLAAQEEERRHMRYYT